MNGFLTGLRESTKVGEPGFAAFGVPCAASLSHTEDPRVRADPNTVLSAGHQWFELFGRLRTLPMLIIRHCILFKRLVAACMLLGWQAL